MHLRFGMAMGSPLSPIGCVHEWLENKGNIGNRLYHLPSSLLGIWRRYVDPVLEIVTGAYPGRLCPPPHRITKGASKKERAKGEKRKGERKGKRRRGQKGKREVNQHDENGAILVWDAPLNDANWLQILFFSPLLMGAHPPQTPLYPPHRHRS